MSGHESTYEPKTGIEKWIDARLPIVRLIHGSFVDFPVAKNLNYWWTFGAILAVCLMTQIITGVFLAMFYKPDVNEAFNSVERIMRDVEYGWLIRYIHANGASMFFLAVYIHMFRGLYYGSYKAPREISWILGVVIYLLMMGTAFLGYVLPWGQMSYHGSSVITSLIGAIPLVGETIKTTLQGGPSIGEATLNRFFSLHYLLPFIIAGVVVLHIWAFHTTGNNNPTGVDVKTKKDTVPFHPYYTVKDGFAIIVFLLIFAGFVFYAPNVLGHADNYIKADPLKTPAHIVPEWYLLPFYAMLRAITFDIGPITAKLGGVIVMFGSIAILFVLPWLDTSKVRSLRYRPLARQFFFAFVAVSLGLGVAGASNPDDVLIPTGESKLQFETKVRAIETNLEGDQLAAVKAEIVAAARQAELDRQAALEAAAGGDDTTEEATEEPAASEEPVVSEDDTSSATDAETSATAETETADASVPEAPAVTEEMEATPEEDTVSEEEPVYVIFRDEFSADAKETGSNVNFKKDSTEVFTSETAGDVKLSVYSAKVQNADYEQIMELGETYQLGDRPAVTHPGIKWLIVTQLLTLCYFAYFLIILPLLGLIEKPKDEPESIAKAVNKRKSTGTTGSDATVAAE